MGSISNAARKSNEPRGTAPISEWQQRKHVDAMKTHAAQILRAEAIQAVPPHSVDAEKGVIGSMMDVHEGAIAMAKARSQIDADYFCVPAHGTTFGALCAMRDEGSCIDLITVTQFLRDSGQLDEVGGAAYVTELATFAPAAANVQDYIDIVVEKHILRETKRAAEIAVRRTTEAQENESPHVILDELESRIASLRSLHGRNGEAEKSWSDALSEAVVTSRQLGELTLTPRKKLLGDWFCEGDLGFIFAFRGVGKTWLALAIAQAVSTAGKLGPWEAKECVLVLYVDGEMPPDLMRDRAQGLEQGNDNLEFLNHLILFERTGKVLNIADLEVQRALSAHCIKNSVKVLILDNLSTLASGMKENEADSWEKLNPWLLDLRRRGIAVVIVHHAGRSGQMRGTSKREDNVFWIIALDDQKKNAEDKRGACFISHFTKPSRNTQEEVPAYKWHFVTEENGKVSIGCEQAQTLDVFRSVIESGVTKCDEIADAMKLPKYEVSRMAKKAEKDGWLIRPRRGEYDIKK